MNATTTSNTANHRLRRAGVLVLLAALGLPLASAAAATPTLRPAAVPSAAVPSIALPALGPVTSTACTTGTGAISCDLYAKSGSTTLPGLASVPVWGYTSLAGDSLAAPGGPTLIVNAGQLVTVNLYNTLGEATSLLFQGQSLVPDRSGAGAGTVGTPTLKTYTFTPSKPGTYLYEAGLTPNSEHQTAMGMHGALIVRGATANQAYDAGLYAASSAYDDEAVLVLSELDPALNNSASPGAFDMRNFAPKYGLINGVPSPSTAAITSAAGNKVLLRYVNAGVQPHSMAVLGLHETVVANDGNPYTYPRVVVADTISPGQTSDAVATIPAGATSGVSYPVYDGSLSLHNSTTAGIGGMLALITLGSGGGATPPPAVSGLAATALSIDATVTAAAGSTVTAAEFYVDSTGGAATAMTGTFGIQTVAVTAATPTLTVGLHTIYVRGRDASGWGPFSSTTLTVAGTDTLGPITTAVAAAPSPTNGTATVALSATVSDATTGTSNVVAAEYFVDTLGADGTGTPMTVASAAPTSAVTATLLAATVVALTDGLHTVYVHGQDSAVPGNWGTAVTTTFVVDKSAPVTAGVTLTPSTSNGLVNVTLSATVSDTATGGSNVTAAEYSIDAVVTAGTGTAMTVGSGSSVTATATIAAATVNALTAGAHTVYVRGRDAAGNWSVNATATLTKNVAGPTTTAIVIAPDPANGVMGVNSGTPAERVTALVAVVGGVSVTAAEVFIDTVGAVGTGIVMSPADGTFNGSSENVIVDIPLNTIAALQAAGTFGTHTVYVRGRDASGVWGATVAKTFVVDRTAPTFTGITVAPNPIVQGTATAVLTVTGAADTGSSVAGGEYWFGTTNPAPGGGTAFTGLAPAIATAALNPGTITVRARVRDAAGNWSTGTNGVRSATFTVTPADPIFANGFEAATGAVSPWGWSSASTANATRLTVNAASASVGALGLQAQNNNTNYVQYNFATAANPATATFDARFRFRPNANVSTGKDIFSAATNTGFGTQLFRVRYRRNGTQAEVQLQVGPTTAATWVAIADGASNTIEVVWQSGTNVRLYVGGSLVQTMTAGAGSVGAFRLGSLAAGTATTLMYFDDLSAKRSITPLFGP